MKIKKRAEGRPRVVYISGYCCALEESCAISPQDVFGENEPPVVKTDDDEGGGSSSCISNAGYLVDWEHPQSIVSLDARRCEFPRAADPVGAPSVLHVLPTRQWFGEVVPLPYFALQLPPPPKTSTDAAEGEGVEEPPLQHVKLEEGDTPRECTKSEWRRAIVSLRTVLRQMIKERTYPALPGKKHVPLRESRLPLARRIAVRTVVSTPSSMEAAESTIRVDRTTRTEVRIAGWQTLTGHNAFLAMRSALRESGRVVTASEASAIWRSLPMDEKLRYRAVAARSFHRKSKEEP